MKSHGLQEDVRSDKPVPMVAVVVVNYNGCELTCACLASLEEVDYPHLRVLVVDNGSTDGSVEVLRQRFPGVILLASERNLGFAGGNNLALRHQAVREADYVLLLNNDTEVDRRFLREMIDAVQNRPWVGMANPKILYHETASLIWYGGGRISFFRGALHLGMGKANDPRYDSIREVDFVTGCAFLIKHSVLEKIGLLREKLFMYCEDLDWSLRIRAAGYTGLYVPRALVWHKQDPRGGESASPWRKRWGTRNLLLVYSAHFPAWKRWLFQGYFFLLWAPFKSLRHLLRGRPETAVAIWQGVWEYLRMDKSL